MFRGVTIEGGGDIDEHLLAFQFSSAYPHPKTSIEIDYSTEAHTSCLNESSSSRSSLSVIDSGSNSRIHGSSIRNRVEISCTADATENPFLVGPLESLLQCVFHHYNNRNYRLPVGPKEFPSKNIEMLFRASRTLLQENIEDRLAL